MSRLLHGVALLCASLLACTFDAASANILLNPGFEDGEDADASDWLQVSGPSGSTSRSSAMPNSGSYSAYMQADHFTNPAAPTPYTFEQTQPVGSIDNTLNYNLSFSAKVDTLEFDGFDMFYQLLWLDQDGSDEGGVKGEILNQLIPAGINTEYQQFGVSDLDVPDGADSFQLRFQLSPGAVEDIANGLYIDDVSLAVNTSGRPLGDYNDDGEVDNDDFLVWETSFGQTGPFPVVGNNPDGNSDNFVDAADYTVWRDNAVTGDFFSPDFATSVPEPASLLLLLPLALAYRRQ